MEQFSFIIERTTKYNFDEAALHEAFLKDTLENIDEKIAKAKSQDDREYVLREILYNFELLKPEVKEKYQNQVTATIENHFRNPDEVISFASKAQIRNKIEGKLILMSYIKNIHDTNLFYTSLLEGFRVGILENSDLLREK